MRRVGPGTIERMRRWRAVAFWLSLSVSLGAGCSSSAAPADAPTPTQAGARPTPSGPTPTLPLARALASPSASPSAVAAGSAQAAATQSFALQSSAFNDGGTLPADFTCDGSGQSPPLSWSGAPPGTAAYSLIEQDSDANSQPYTNWLMYNMPRTVTQLPAGVMPRPLLPNGVQQGTNSSQMVGYLGACPNQGDPPHHYQFQLFAQDSYVTLETGATYDAVRDALSGHTLGQTQLTATFQR
jgi:Raf kinase inhibitor-like YbhB/YbcL family protein